MGVVNVNIVSVLNRVIGEVTAVRDALNTVGTQPTANNTGSPKLPSSIEIWNMVKEHMSDKELSCSYADARSISQAIYEFVRRQLRAGA